MNVPETFLFEHVRYFGVIAIVEPLSKEEEMFAVPGYEIMLNPAQILMYADNTKNRRNYGWEVIKRENTAFVIPSISMQRPY